jgi:phenylalanyl-tRNA synthetase beta chain
MKFPYSWIKEYVSSTLSPQDLGERLTMAGLEVKDIAVRGSDYVFEAEITSNRPDWLSVRGVAREVAALTGRNFKEPVVVWEPEARLRRFPVRVEDPDACPLYTAHVIRSVRVGESPGWLRERLEMLGCRSVNAIVDVTNYVLFEYGTPLHAFDLGRLSGMGVLVRRATPSETLVTIDGVRRQLNGDMLVIADSGRPIALAGIMGGKDTEVSESTTDILLEGAVFAPALTRKTRQALGIMTESAYRFERGVDPSSVPEAARAAVRMITQLCGGRVDGLARVGARRMRPVCVHVDNNALARILGTRIPLKDTRRILSSLGFSVRGTQERLKVCVPSYRRDVSCAEDLIEEVGRIYGYDRIPATMPQVRARIPAVVSDAAAAVRSRAAALGLTEVITYSMVSGAKVTGYPVALQPREPVALRNPVSAGESLLRQSLVPSLVDRVAYNLNQGCDSVSLFEIAHVFGRDHRGVRETEQLGIVLCGVRHMLLAGGAVRDRITIAHVKGIVESLAASCGVRELSFALCNDGCSYSATTGQEIIGTIGSVPVSALESAKIKNRDVFYAAIDLEVFLRHAAATALYVPLPKYPGMIRDISCSLPETQDIRAVLAAVARSAGPYLKNVRITDYYVGKQIAAGRRGLTISCLYRSDERTLTDADIEPVHARAVALLVDEFGASIR